MIKNQVAILDKIGETAWAVVDKRGWLVRGFPRGDQQRILFPSRAQARELEREVGREEAGLRTVKVKLVLA